MERIVVGVDESAGSAEALEWAVRERRLRGGALSAVLAWTYLGQHHGIGGDAFQPEYHEADAAKALDELLTKFVPDDAADIERKVVCDLPVKALLAESAGADLLVVGARGLGGFRGLLLGSVSQQCAHHTTVPMAIVRGLPEPLASERIVVGVDGSENSRHALAWALDEARLREARLAVVHSWQPVVVPAFGVMTPYYDPVEFQDEGASLVEEQFAALGGRPTDVEVDTVIVGDTPVHALLEASAGASLIVVGSRGRGGFKSLLLGSVGQHIVHHARCPVVLIPHGWTPSAAPASRADRGG